MKTNVKFGSSYDEKRVIIVGVIERLLGGQASESEITSATNAVCEAFIKADTGAGNGYSNIACGRCEDFFAEVDAEDHSFELYQRITPNTN